MKCKISKDGYEACAAMAQFINTRATQGFRLLMNSGQKVEGGKLVQVPVVVTGVTYGQGRGTNTLLNRCPWCGESLEVN